MAHWQVPWESFKLHYFTDSKVKASDPRYLIGFIENNIFIYRIVFSGRHQMKKGGLMVSAVNGVLPGLSRCLILLLESYWQKNRSWDTKSFIQRIYPLLKFVSIRPSFLKNAFLNLNLKAHSYGDLTYLSPTSSVRRGRVS